VCATTTAWLTAGCAVSTVLDLARLHPKAADLDLGVDAAEEHQVELAIVVAAEGDQITRAVEACAGRSERVGYEFAGRQPGRVEISPRHADAPDVELPGNAERDGMTEPVEDIGGVVGQVDADRRTVVQRLMRAVVN
jgi:hypothetical protein